MRRIECCPACGNDNVATVVRADEEQRVRFLRYSGVKYGGCMDLWLRDIELVVLRCCSCDHHWYRDQPDDEQLSDMYSASRSFSGEVIIGMHPTDHMLKEMRRLRRLVRSIAAPSMLDYGSGYGRWARAALLESFNVSAYEPSITRGRDDRAEFFLTHDLASLQDQRFDVVNVEQVLEHVADPLAALAHLRTLCQPRAVVRITVPNIQRSNEGARLWRDWPFNGRAVHTMAPFEHLHGFTPTSLACLVRRAGFRRLNWSRVVLTHPHVWARSIVGRFWKRLGHTFVLVEPD
jgi:2-polyprenyl-3-methyl-5-hydroxy-6-metoxy-1,4-benzoquinol methylase